MTDLHKTPWGPGPARRLAAGTRGAARSATTASATPPPYPAEPRGHDPGHNSRDLREPFEPSPPSGTFSRTPGPGPWPGI